LDSYLLSVAEGQRLARASRELVRRCMAARGLAYGTAEPVAVGPRTWNERRYGLADPAQAALGYWPAERVPVARPRHGAQPAAVTAALTGDSGCAAAASRELTARDPAGADRYLAQRLSTDSFFASQRDPAVRAVVAAWSECVRRATGTRYGSPLDAAADRRFAGRTAGGTEIATAKADVACKERTHLIGVWAGVESRLQGALIARNRPGLRLARAAFEAELAVAAAL
jgi:hypothetical protein